MPTIELPRLAERPFNDAFKELCFYYPLFYLDVYEMREILKVEARYLEDLYGATDIILDNNFILFADEDTLSLWEGLLQIEYEDVPEDLDTRREVIIARLRGNRHFGEPEIRAAVSPFIDGDIAVKMGSPEHPGTIFITVVQDEEDGMRNVRDAKRALEPMKPAHLLSDFRVIMRRNERQELYSGFGLYTYGRERIDCEIPSDLEVTYLVDENDAILLDENNARLIDEEE